MNYPILAIETTGAFGSVVIKDKNGKIYIECLDEKLNHLKGLLPLIHKSLGDAGLEMDEIKTIAVSHGPGSFTGIRIGISTVRSIAQVTGARVIGVPTLEAFIFNNEEYKGIVCPIFDARMDQLYGGAFVLNDGEIEALIETGAYGISDFSEMLSRVIYNYDEKNKTSPELKFYGEGIDVFKNDLIRWERDMMAEQIKGFTCSFEDVKKFQTALSVLKWAERYGEEKEYTELLPVYIRKAEAQRRLDEKNACKE